MSNSSATGGYLTPTSTNGFPNNLTLDQFIQTILVGISGLQGDLVRPKWQENPPKQPGIKTNWIAFRTALITPDTYEFTGMDLSGNPFTQRYQNLSVQCSIYGPDAANVAGVLRDGFQIAQNREAMNAVGLKFVNTGYPSLIPDFVNERWVQKYEMEIVLRQMVQRSYAILPLLEGPGGQIRSDLNPTTYIKNWQTPEES